jgi:hypothetical protein
MRKTDHLEGPDVDGVMDWIDLAQVKGRWLAVVNAVMKLVFR